MSGEAKISIIILNYNNDKDTVECVNSVKMLDYPDFEIILVDNGSSDGSYEKLKERFGNLMFIRNPKNLGFAEGNNVGIRQALANSADYVLVLNNDTIIDKNFLNEMLAASKRHPKALIFGPKIYFADDQKKLWYAGGKINRLTGLPYHIGENKMDNGQYDNEREVEFVTGCAMFIKTELFDSIGFFDPDYFCFCEDADLCFRARKRGTRLVYVPSSILWHKIASTIGRYSPFYLYYRTRNPLIYVMKNKIRTPFFLLIYFYSLLRRLVGALVTLNFKGISAIISGFFDALTGRSKRRFGSLNVGKRG